ncbi:unnamed protein product [Boreogadus saida]
MDVNTPCLHSCVALSQFSTLGLETGICLMSPQHLYPPLHSALVPEGDLALNPRRGLKTLTTFSISISNIVDDAACDVQLC